MNYSKECKQIEKAFPELGSTRLNGGLQMRFSSGRNLTFWFRKKKYCDSKGNEWKLFGSVKDIINILKQISNQISEHQETAPVEIKKQTPKLVQQFDDKGTQACIDHVVRKLARYRELNPTKAGNETACMLLMISEELKQYL